jgi:hypothetical protein
MTATATVRQWSRRCLAGTATCPLELGPSDLHNWNGIFRSWPSANCLQLSSVLQFRTLALVSPPRRQPCSFSFEAAVLKATNWRAWQTHPSLRVSTHVKLKVSGGIPIKSHFAYFSANFCLKICTTKIKMYYRWDLGGIPADTRSPVWCWVLEVAGQIGGSPPTRRMGPAGRRCGRDREPIGWGIAAGGCNPDEIERAWMDWGYKAATAMVQKS